MIFLYIYIGIGLTTFVLCSLASVVIGNKFKRKYPGLKYSEKTATEIFLIFLRTLAASFVPIMHIAILWVLVFKYSKLEKKTFNELYIECMKNNEKESDTESL